jgi:hypothetical protein
VTRPIVIAQKPGGKIRICVDFRKWNKVTKKKPSRRRPPSERLSLQQYQLSSQVLPVDHLCSSREPVAGRGAFSELQRIYRRSWSFCRSSEVSSPDARNVRVVLFFRRFSEICVVSSLSFPPLLLILSFL